MHKFISEQTYLYVNTHIHTYYRREKKRYHHHNFIFNSTFIFILKIPNKYENKQTNKQTNKQRNEPVSVFSCSADTRW